MKKKVRISSLPKLSCTENIPIALLIAARHALQLTPRTEVIQIKILQTIDFLLKAEPSNRLLTSPVLCVEEISGDGQFLGQRT